MNTRLVLGGLLLAASTALFAQSPTHDTKSGAPEGRHAMRPCAQEADPAQCETRRMERREHMSRAREACKGMEGQERGPCMAAQICAKAPDPAKCQARAKERAEHRNAKREKHERQEQQQKRGAPGAEKS